MPSAHVRACRDRLFDFAIMDLSNLGEPQIMNQAKNGSWTRIGIISVALCSYAGFRYGIFVSGIEPICDYSGRSHVLSAQELSALTFSTSLDLFSVVFLIWSVGTRQYVIEAIALTLFAFAVLWGVSFYLDAVIPLF